MSQFRKFATIGVLSVLVVASAVACGSDSDDESSATSDSAGAETFDFGEPADEADADRVVEIDMLDELAFDPDEIEVTAGETITFSVTNSGNLEHDFTLGDDETQAEHEAEMREESDADMDAEGMHGDPNAITVATGETADLTWTFTEPGEVLYGCHVEGHYDGGMVGTITVT